MTDAFVHLRVPAAIKARWVRESRAAGMRLTDWIVQRVEAPTQKLTTIAIPAGGAPDQVAEDLIAETRAEEERGGGFIHQPGRA